MQIEPAEQAFAERYAAGEAQVVWTTLVADLETPVSAFLKVAGGRPMSFLLESVEGGVTRGRYSIIGLDPDLVWRANGAGAEINRAARSNPNNFAPCSEAPLASLRALLAESRIELPERLPPMAAGLFGYLGYDMVRLMEELPPANMDPIGIPDAILVRPSLVIVFDAVEDTLTVVTPVRPEAGVPARTALARAVDRLSAVIDDLDRPLDKEASDGHAGALQMPPSSNTSPQEFAAMVLRAKEYIVAGDIFQVVLSQRFEAPFALPPFALYALAGGFPAGTVSGAPKVRAMEIIDELEKEKRGIYAGCVGYFSAGGEMDTCIVLRTALIKDGTMYVQAGAGIVADSDPDFEQQECVSKARALFRAAEEARRFASVAKRGQ